MAKLFSLSSTATCRSDDCHFRHHPSTSQAVSAIQSGMTTCLAQATITARKSNPCMGNAIRSRLRAPGRQAFRPTCRHTFPAVSHSRRHLFSTSKCTGKLLPARSDKYKKITRDDIEAFKGITSGVLSTVEGAKTAGDDDLVAFNEDWMCVWPCNFRVAKFRELRI